MADLYVKEIVKELKKEYKQTALNEINGRGPFQVLISTVLSQRTRDENTRIASNRLFAKFDTVEKLARADLSEIERLIKASGFYKTKARRIKEIAQKLVERYDGEVPEKLDELLDLPGVGRKTAACVIVYGFNKPAIPVDTHVHRISNRLGWVKTKTPEQTEQELMKKIEKKYWMDINDLFVSHGQNTCKPIRPKCSECKIYRYCKRAGVVYKI